jgi:hypothetical protein
MWWHAFEFVLTGNADDTVLMRERIDKIWVFLWALLVCQPDFLERWN